MSHNAPIARRHPLTGEPLRPIYVSPRTGRVFWPVIGASEDTPPERPEDIAEETWSALGDPGKRALVSERSARQEAERSRDAAIRERDAARTQPPANGGGGNNGAGGGQSTTDTGAGNGNSGGTGQPDIAALVTKAVEAAVAPLRQAEEQRQTQQAAQRIADAVVEAAKPLLHDATDALANVDLTTVVDDSGQVDQDKVRTALEDVVKRKPHLAKGPRQAPLGIGGGAPAAATDAEKVKAVLADMQRATGVRPAAVSTT